MKEIELIGKRRTREKHFLKKDGIIEAQVFDEDIHFLKDGIYEEIDNTLIDKGDYYTNKNNSYSVKFYKVSKDELTYINIGNNYIKTKLINCNLSILKENIIESKLHKNVCYPNILDNIDLEYNVMPTKVKEAIILKNKDVDLEKLVFYLETNMDLELSENKKIVAKTDKYQIFEFDAPYMVDKDFKVSNNIFYKLSKIEDCKYLLSFDIDNEWLNSQETKYPVMIDPTITNSDGSRGVYDTYIYAGDTNDDRNSQDILKVGVERINGVDRTNRALIKFDLPNIGTGSQVVDASIEVYGYPVAPATYDDEFVTVHQITSAWDEATANWVSMNDKYNPLVEGIMVASRGYYDFENNVACPSHCFADITRLVKKWYTGTPNNGLMLKQNEEKYNPNLLLAFYSKNNNSAMDNPKPLISVSYRNQNGLLDYMDYQSLNFTDGASYVNSYNGNLTTVFDIGSTIGGKMPAVLNLVYNTNDVVLNSNIGYGLGCKFSLHQTIKEQPINEKTYLEYMDEYGTLHYFLNRRTTFGDSGYSSTDTGNTYYDEDGLDMTIIKNNNNYVLKDKKGNTMTFITNGDRAYLFEAKDISNNVNNIEYDENKRIIKVKDANGTEINISYENNKITILSPDETVTLMYSNNKLTSITSYNGVTNFEYNENNIISKIKDVTNVSICYEYYSQKPYKVKKILEYGCNNTLGQYHNIEYGFDSTTIIDSSNNTRNIIFNSQGSIVSISNLKNKDDINEAYGMSQTNGINDGTNPGYNNKLLNNEIPLKYVKNLLSNTSFEKDIIDFEKTDYVSLSISNEAFETGLKSLKVVSTGAAQEITRILDVTKGNYYTFSAYLKNNNKIRLGFSYIDENNNEVSLQGETIEPNDNFERYDITIEYPSTATGYLKLKIYFDENGVTFIDDIQLEIGEVANNYNLLENSDFSNGISDWTLSAINTRTGEDLSTNDKFEVVTFDNGIKALKTKMNPIIECSMEKSFDICGKGGDSFNFSFWYKNRGIDSNLSMHYGSRVYIIFKYTDSEENGACVLPTPLLNINDDAWQYVSNSFVAEKDYTSITVLVSHEYTANDFYITNMNLFKNIRSVNYEYDEFGNVILERNLNKNEFNFNYDSNNELIKMSNPKGKSFLFEYDNIITDRIINGFSDMGVSNEIKYDSNSNPILTRVIKNGISDKITTGLYKIRIKGTNKYFKNSSNEITIGYSDYNLDTWLLDIDGDNYKIRHSILPNRYLSIADDLIKLSDYNDTNSLFTLIKNNNGSYYIKLKTKEKYVKLNDNYLQIAELENGNHNFEFYFETVYFNDFIENKAFYIDNSKYIKSITNSLGNSISYNINETTGLLNSETDMKGNVTEYSYNNKKQLTATISNDKKALYVYNDKNLLSKVKHGTKEYNFIYDEFLNTKQIKIGNDITLVTNNYDEIGNLNSFQYGNGDIIEYEYDEFYRLKKTTKQDDVYNYKYDNNGNLVKVQSDHNNIKYFYDLSGKLSESNFNNFKTKYIYDSNGNVINLKYKLGNIKKEVSTTYNDDDLVTKTNFENNEMTYSYDSLGRLINSSINGNLNISYEHLKMGRNTSSTVNKVINDGDIYFYKYDRMNNITHIYFNGILENRYYYDNYNQLVKNKDYVSKTIIIYEYDNVGNLLCIKKYNMDSYNLIDKDVYEYNNNLWEDQLTKYNNIDIIYDEIGNPIKIGNDKFLTWINGRQLSSYSDSINNINYNYNENGIRIKKTINSVETNYYLEDNDIIFEKTGNNVLYYIRSTMDDLIGFKYNDDIYYYVKNIQGDIIAIKNTNFDIVAKYKYDPWGKIISITDGDGNDVIENENHIANINPFRYRSYYYDRETKLYYLNERYYNPAWKRFINSDSYGGEVGGNILSHNMYAYALNNPIGNYDEDGNLALSLSSYGLAFAATLILAPLAKKVIGGTAKVISSLINDISHLLSKPKSKPKQKKSSREKAQSKTKVKTAVKIKAGTKPQNNKRNEEKPCVVAIKGNDNRILITNVRMTIDETHDYVEMGGDVMCDSRSYAKRVAKRFDGWYEDRKIKNEIGYYRHFHPWNDRKHPHIWYYSRF